MARPLSLVASAASLFAVLSCADITVGNPGVVRVNAVRKLVDLDPGGPGIFIQNTSPEQCWWGWNAEVPTYDSDADWVDDRCEFAVAAAFAPMMRFHLNNETCGGWQPYWAAKGFGAGERMRIAYMMAYYEDCGIEGHDGDAEMVTVQVLYDAASNHWMLESVWTSAHYQASIGGVSADRSYWHSWPSIEMVDPNRPRAQPRIWVAPGKHANYASLSGCNYHEYTPDSHCNGSYVSDRLFPVHWERNAGSRVADLLGCVAAIDEPNVGSGRCEKFYALSTQSKFNGWFPAVSQEVGGSSRYHDILVSDKFEYYEAGADWGPDHLSPPPNHNPTLGVSIHGTSQIGAGQGCVWNAAVTNGSASSYAWTINGQPYGGGTDYMSYTNNGSDFEIGVVITDPQGHQAAAALSVSIVEDMWCT